MSPGRWERRLLWALVTAGVVGSALHFWPATDSRAWVLAAPWNLAGAAGAVMGCAMLLRPRRRAEAVAALPPTSGGALVAVTALSLAAAPDLLRAGTFMLKLALMYLGATWLLGLAARDDGGRTRIVRLASVAAALAVAACLVARLTGVLEPFGFHRNPLKYGSYVAILTAMGGTYLLLGTGRARPIAGAALIAAAGISGGSISLPIGLAAGLVTAGVVAGAGRRRRLAVAGVVTAVAIGASLSLSWSAPLREDARLRDRAGSDVRQRYLEWQALVNLLETRPALGTGAGCVNTWRGMHYYRLPKANTIQPFDQNGWLATAAETGIVGLLCFTWVIGSSLRRTWLTANRPGRTGERRLAPAVAAGLAAACAVNVFSSVHYNGVLIALVVPVALAGTLGDRPGQEADHAC